MSQVFFSRFLILALIHSSPCRRLLLISYQWLSVRPPYVQEGNCGGKDRRKWGMWWRSCREMSGYTIASLCVYMWAVRVSSVGVVQVTRCWSTTGWSLPRRTRTTTIRRITVPPSTTGPGGTGTATRPTWMDSTWRASTPPTPTASSGPPGLAGSTRSSSPRWRSDPLERKTSEVEGRFKKKKNTTMKENTDKQAVFVRNFDCWIMRTFWWFSSPSVYCGPSFTLLTHSRSC